MELKRRPDIDRFLAGPSREHRGVVFYGRDRGVVRERADVVAKVVARDPDDPFDVAQLADADLSDDGGRLESELTAQSMMGGKRLVRLRISAEKGPLDKAAAETLVAHAEGRLNPDAYFLVEAGALGRDSALRKAAEKAAGIACVPCYEDEPGDVARMVRESLARDQVSLSADALEAFISRLPKERGVARAEIERLALFLGPGSGRQASVADLDQFMGVEPEASLFDAASDAFGGRMAPAQSGVRRAFGEGETGPAAVRAVGMHLAKLRRVLTLARSGADMKEAAKSAGVFWKQEREFLRQARAWTLAELDRIQPDVLGADRACKQASSPDTLIAERLLLSVAGKARRLGL
jgi:DNA polymerase-3 subunit delta